MRISQFVQPVERLFNLRIYPGFSAIRGFFGTNSNHFGKGEVGGNAEPVRPDDLAERTRHPEIIKRDDRPRLGFNPEGFRIIAGIGHREDSRRIGFQQQIKFDGHGRVINRLELQAQSLFFANRVYNPAIGADRLMTSTGNGSDVEGAGRIGDARFICNEFDCVIRDPCYREA